MDLEQKIRSAIIGETDATAYLNKDWENRLTERILLYVKESFPVELPVMLIFNEHFMWHKEDGQYFITHPKWSLVGMGENLQDAHRDLLEEINITRIHFIDIPDEELTEEAKKMKYWLLPIKVKNSA